MATTVLGAHLPYFLGGFQVENDLVVGTWFSLGSDLPANGHLFGQVVGTRTRDLEPYKLWPEKDPHPDYRTVLRGWEIGSFFTEFTAATKPEDVRWLTDVDFSCMTRWTSRVGMADSLPSAWAKFQAERKQVSAIQERIADCGYPLQNLVKASERVAVVQVDKPNAEKGQWSPYRARLVESLKGSSSWHSGDGRAIWSGQDPVARTEILLFAEDSDPVFPHECGVIPATPESLRTVKAAVEGVHQLSRSVPSSLDTPREIHKDRMSVKRAYRTLGSARSKPIPGIAPDHP